MEFSVRICTRRVGGILFLYLLCAANDCACASFLYYLSIKLRNNDICFGELCSQDATMRAHLYGRFEMRIYR